MNKAPVTKRRGLLWWVARVSRFLSLPRGMNRRQLEDLGRSLDWLPLWAMFIVLPLAIAAAFYGGVLLKGLLRW